MPEGLNTGLSLQDFADIVSYLESLKDAAEEVIRERRGTRSTAPGGCRPSR